MPVKTYQDLSASEEQEITDDLEVKPILFYCNYNNKIFLILINFKEPTWWETTKLSRLRCETPVQFIKQIDKSCTSSLRSMWMSETDKGLKSYFEG